MSNIYKLILFEFKLIIKSRISLIFILSIIAANFILSDTARRIARSYKIPLKDVNYWHGVYECLNSNYIVLFVFVIFYVLFVFRNIYDFENKFFMLRIKSKKNWLINKLLFLTIFPFIYTSIYFFIMLLGNLIFFGAPESINWGSYKVSYFNPISGIVLTYFVKIFLLFILSWIFTALYIFTGNIYKALLISLGYYCFCYVFNTFIPIEVIKPFTILGGISISYFESGNPYLNIIYVFGGGIICFIALSAIISKYINKFEIDKR